MDKINKYDADYKTWLIELKAKIRSAQVKVAISANSVMIDFYLEMGKMISEKQKESKWGDKLIDQLAKDLKSEFSEISGLSPSNLKYCKRFYLFYKNVIGQQPVDQFDELLIKQIPWGHNILIFTKSANLLEAEFYCKQTIENQWSRDILAMQIKSNLYKRIGKSITNFKHTLPEPLSELAQQTLKDPYRFDFMTMSTKFVEKDMEKQLVSHITKFLLELGKGFAFIGQQYHLEIAGNDYYLDLLFYHTILKCYVIIELKNSKFMPEYTGKLNFYLSAVDTLLKQEDDKPTIGILLCRDKNNIEAEFALRDINKPMGVSEFQLTEVLPDYIKSSLPSIAELEEEIRNMDK